MEFLTHHPSKGTRKAGAEPAAGRMPIWIGLLLWLSSSFLAGLQAQTPGNLLAYQVKAAFLLNFTKFVEWPQAAFAAPDSSIAICVLGEDPFGTILDRTIEGEMVGSRAVRARRLTPDDDLRDCHVLFIGRSEREQFPKIVSQLRGSSVLTVSELPGFADAGGMFEFIVDEGKARFYINARATEAAGLRLSSRLLRVAKEIKRS
jgi:hypothetical protein